MKVVPITILDMCCGAGLATDGYSSVGFETWGLDKVEQENYPGVFIKGDVLETLRSNMPENFAALHISPPCQLFSTAKHLYKPRDKPGQYTDLLTPTIAILREKWMHKPWVVENVDDNTYEVRKIMKPRKGEYLITLCGSMFGLPIQRHRVFLSNVKLRQPLCKHDIWEKDPVTGNPKPWGIYHQPSQRMMSGGGRIALSAEHARELMGVYRTLPWDELKEGFPPAYAAHIGADLLFAIQSKGSTMAEEARDDFTDVIPESEEEDVLEEDGIDDIPETVLLEINKELSRPTDEELVAEIKKPREMTVIDFGTKKTMFDLRPHAIGVEESSSPKDLSAQGSVSLSQSFVQMEAGFSANPVETVVVVKDNGVLKENETGSQTS